MPENKKPLIRYQIIDRCIRNTARVYSAKDLQEAINEELNYRGLEPIGRTTFYQDLRDMEIEFNAPIEKHWKDGKKVYEYSDPEYSFGNQPLNQGEIEHLKDAAMILSRFSGIPGFEWIDEIVSKLELGTIAEFRDPGVISFESNEFLKGKEFIGSLFHAITQRKVVEISYQTFNSTRKRKHIVHPYHLKEYDSRWYILGYFPPKDDLITLGVDRIDQIKFLENKRYIKNTRFDFMDYFEDIIGILKDRTKKEVELILKFTPLMANYVETKPLHGSQKVVRKEEDGSLTVSIQVIPNNELENLIFSFKDEVVVLEPHSLRKQIQQVINSMAGKYG